MYIHIKPYKPARIQCQQNMPLWHHERCSAETTMGGLDLIESTCNAGDWGLIPGLGRCPGEGTGYLLQYSCLGNPMDGGARRATAHGVAMSWTQLSN